MGRTTRATPAQIPADPFEELKDSDPIAPDQQQTPEHGDATPADPPESTSPAPDQSAAFPRFVRVNAPNRLRLRPTPSKTYPEILLLNHGEMLTVTGDAVDAEGDTWQLVATATGTAGYVMAKHLTNLDE